MDIRVQTSGGPCSPQMAAHVRLSLHDRLLHHGDRVERVEVRLGDPRGRRPGDDIYCLMQVHVSEAPAVTVIDVGEDMFLTIDRAAERVGRLAGAQLQASKAQPAGASSRQGAPGDVPARRPRHRGTPRSAPVTGFGYE